MLFIFMKYISHTFAAKLKSTAGMLLAGICCVSAFAEEGDSQTIIGKVLDNKGMKLLSLTDILFR